MFPLVEARLHFAQCRADSFALECTEHLPGKIGTQPRLADKRRLGHRHGGFLCARADEGKSVAHQDATLRNHRWWHVDEFDVAGLEVLDKLFHGRENSNCSRGNWETIKRNLPLVVRSMASVNSNRIRIESPSRRWLP